MRTLAQSRSCLVAAPSVLAGFEGALRPTDLFELPSLCWGANVQDYTWELDGPDGAVASIHFRPRMVSDDVAVLREGALAGVGAVMLPESFVKGDLESGRLVNVLDGWTPRTGEVVAIFPSRRGLMPAVRKLIDYLADAFESESMVIPSVSG